MSWALVLVTVSTTNSHTIMLTCWRFQWLRVFRCRLWVYTIVVPHPIGCPYDSNTWPKAHSICVPWGQALNTYIRTPPSISQNPHPHPSTVFLPPIRNALTGLAFVWIYSTSHYLSISNECVYLTPVLSQFAIPVSPNLRKFALAGSQW